MDNKPSGRTSYKVTVDKKKTLMTPKTRSVSFKYTPNKDLAVASPRFRVIIQIYQHPRFILN